MSRAPKGAADAAGRIDSDKLKKLRTMVTEARDLETRKVQLEQDSKELNKQINTMFRKDLPEFMDELGVSSIALDPEGNYPGVEAKSMPYYHANIAASWSPEKRAAAFQWLEGNGFGDLIKTQFVVDVPRGSIEVAKAVEDALMNLGVNFSQSLAVPWGTLTAWLREQVEDHRMPPLEVIGGDVGRIVKLKQKKDG